MDPIITLAVGGILAGAMVTLMIVLKTRYPVGSQQKMPVLHVRKSRTVSRARSRRTASSSKTRRLTASSPSRRRPSKTKTVDTSVVPSEALGNISATTTIALQACPSCGLQAPGSLLDEHFLGSPSHRNGPPKADSIVAVQAKVEGETEEADSKQSVRDLLQILVPPRAFGRRHAQRSVSPISPILGRVGSQPGKY